MDFKVQGRYAMRKLTATLMIAALVLGGISFAMAADQPDALNGVNLSDAQKVTDTEAQSIRGAAQQGPWHYKPPLAGDGIQDHYGLTDSWPGPHSPSK